MSENDLQVEVELLRERLKEYRELLQVSYSIIFMPHKDIEKRSQTKNLYKVRLLEHGIIEESNDEQRNRI